jgi:pimeloyl-ACP methyl ester carboxylesterase
MQPAHRSHIGHATHATLTSRLAERLDLCQPLLASSASPLRLFPVVEGDTSVVFDVDDVARCNQVVAAVGSRFSFVPLEFVWPAPEEPSSLELSISTFCELGLEDWRALAASAADGTLASELGRLPSFGNEVRRDLQPVGLPPFATFAQGDPSHEAIVIVPPCGVPARLFRPWLEALSNDFFVLTYENPYLFGDWKRQPEPSGELATEVALVGAMLIEHGITRAHLIGICGGAPIAVAVAAEFGERVASLIICHGDLYFGAETPRTAFQMQFQGLLKEAATNLSRAREIHAVFLDPSIHYSLPPRLAPFVMVPYGDLGLFRRYARINHALMAYDATAAASKLGSHLLIVTSRNDRMTHPVASYQLQQLVGNSRLWARDSGTHHDVLLPNQELFSAIEEFVKEPSQ